MATANKESVYPWVRSEEVLSQEGIRANVLLVDVRTPAEYAEAHIPGSQNVPLANIARSLDMVKAQGRDKQVVVMCRTQNRATLAHEQLVSAGVADCQILKGGMTEWLKADFPVIRGEKAVSLERQVRMVAGAFIVLGVLLGVAMNPWWHVLPAFVGGGLFYAGLTDSCVMGMLLARLPFNRKP